MPDQLYKILGRNGEAIHGGSGTWFLPQGNRPGKWMPKVNEVRVCYTGYHLLKPMALLVWMDRDVKIFVAEGRGTADNGDEGKIAFQQARLIRVTAWTRICYPLFAADCAERSLESFERTFPDDKRPRQAIEVARKFAAGECSLEEVRAAWSAAESAAWSAAWSAARAAQTARLLQYIHHGAAAVALPWPVLAETKGTSDNA